MLSFIVPAHDEEASIVATVRAIRAAATSAQAPFEIIVVDDASSDRTAALATAEGAQVLRIERRQIARRATPAPVRRAARRSCSSMPTR
jgi:glycosyltransferase involved in cell wall biosynthesis